MNETSIESELLTWVKQNFLDGDALDELDANTSLLDAGLLTSLRMMLLLAFVEERFTVELAPNHFEFAAFQSIKGIAAFVNKGMAG